MAGNFREPLVSWSKRTRWTSGMLICSNQPVGTQRSVMLQPTSGALHDQCYSNPTNQSWRLAARVCYFRSLRPKMARVWQVSNGDEEKEGNECMTLKADRAVKRRGLICRCPCACWMLFFASLRNCTLKVAQCNTPRHYRLLIRKNALFSSNVTRNGTTLALDATVSTASHVFKSWDFSRMKVLPVAPAVK